MKSYIAFVASLYLLAIAPGPVAAQDAVEAAEDLERVPELPEEPPPEIEPGGEPLEPEVTITRREGATVREYRVNGQLYMIQVVPDRGRPYYVVDSDGDGRLDLRGEGLDPPDAFQWPIFSW